MKRCPICGRTYDDALAFCREDGAALAPAPLPSPPLPAHASPAPQPGSGRQRAAVAVLGVAAAVLLGVVAFLLTRERATEVEAAPEMATMAVPPDRRGDLGVVGGTGPPPAAREYERPAVIDDADGYTNVRSQASTNAAVVAVVRAGEVFHTHEQPGSWWHVRTPTGAYGYVHASRIRLLPLEPAPRTAPAAEYAFADSPGDGFVALRSAPSVRRGARLLRIPHGEAVEVLSCAGPADVADGRSGTWCRVRYDGAEGWAFDAFLRWPA